MADQVETPNSNGAHGTPPLESLKQASDGVRAKHSNWGGRRVKGSGKSNKSGPRPMAGSPGVEQEEAAPAPPIDAEFVSKTIASMLRVVDSVSTRRVHATVKAICKDAALAAEFAKEVQMSEDEIEMVAGTGTVIFQKYQLLGQYAPECLLVLWAVGYGSRQVVTHNKMKELAAWVMAEKAKENQTAPE